MANLMGGAGRVLALAAGASLAFVLASCDASGQVDPGLLLSAGTIRAKDIAFTPSDVSVRAGTSVTITLDNAEDDGIPHGLVVSRGSATLAKSEIITAPGRTTIELPPLDAGRYSFTCPVHPNMTGTITAVP